MDWKSSLESLRAQMPQEPEEQPAQAEAAAVPTAAGETARLDILLDRKGRKGKQATIVAGFTVSDEQVEEIARRLKQHLGTGGSARGGEILIQGDKRREVERVLREMGLKCRVI